MIVFLPIFYHNYSINDIYTTTKNRGYIPLPVGFIEWPGLLQAISGRVPYSASGKDMNVPTNFSHDVRYKRRHIYKKDRGYVPLPVSL